MKQNITAILDILERLYPKGERPWTRRSNAFRTLIATILSAQTTDAQVDLVTPSLFKRYPDAAKLASANARDVERIIKSVGLYKAKARNIIAASKTIVERFHGRVPSTRDELTMLAGVGRKTANVVLIKSFGKAAMPVDTHVFRVSRRIGIAKGKTPQEVERELTKLIPEDRLAAAHFGLIHHGRTICTARKPRCPQCPLLTMCKYGLRVTKQP